MGCQFEFLQFSALNFRKILIFDNDLFVPVVDY